MVLGQMMRSALRCMIGRGLRELLPNYSVPWEGGLDGRSGIHLLLEVAVVEAQNVLQMYRTRVLGDVEVVWGMKRDDDVDGEPRDFEGESQVHASNVSV